MLKIANICINNADYLLVHGPRLLTLLLLNADCFMAVQVGDAREATTTCFGDTPMCVTSEVCMYVGAVY